MAIDSGDRISVATLEEGGGVGAEIACWRGGRGSKFMVGGAGIHHFHDVVM